jgi:hypothetical protein
VRGEELPKGLPRAVLHLDPNVVTHIFKIVKLCNVLLAESLEYLTLTFGVVIPLLPLLDLLDGVVDPHLVKLEYPPRCPLANLLHHILDVTPAHGLIHT